MSKLRADKFNVASGLLVLSGIGAGGLGYLFQIIMGRMLSLQEYGLFSALIAIFMIFSAPLSTLMMLVSRKVSGYRGLDDFLNLGHFFASINTKAMGIGLGLFAIAVVLSNPFANHPELSQLRYVWVIGLLLLSVIPLVINQGFLQGLQYFPVLSLSLALNVCVKIAASVLLVWLGYGVAGAIGGSVVANLVIMAGSYYFIQDDVNKRPVKGTKQGHLPVKTMLPVFIANVAFVAMTQFDMILVNHYFSAESAGQYAAASVLGKAVMYLPSGIATALFPMVAEHHAKQESDIHLLARALKLVALLSGSCAVFYYFFGEFLTTLLYGPEYAEAGRLLQYYGMAILPMSLVMVAEYYLIAKAQVVFAYIFSFVLPFQLLAVYFYHDSLLQVISIMGGTSLVVALAGSLVMVQRFRLPVE